MSQYKKVLIEYISSRYTNKEAIEIRNRINNKILHESDMKDVNNLHITIIKGVLFPEKKLNKKSYITVNGLKNFITASFTYLTRN